jgi:hypothetical protein
MFRELDHDTVVESLTSRGYNLDYVDDYIEDQVNAASEFLESDAPRHAYLDWYEVEGSVTDGLFEDPYNGPDYDFTEFLTHEKLLGRMMYYMVSAFGEDYTFENLVLDIETLSNLAYYEAPFDMERALSQKPEKDDL